MKKGMDRKKSLVMALMMVLMLLSAQQAHSQSVLETIKNKASSMWNSDTRKNIWKKTKEVASSVMEADILQSVTYVVPVTGRDFYNFIPDSYMLTASSKQYALYLRSNSTSTDKQKKSQVSRVSNRLIKAANELLDECGKDDELDSYQWEVNLVRNSDANAFCMPGGKIVVYDGILEFAKDDASLACVLGHEIAHAIAKHSAEQMTKGMISTAGMAALIAMISSSDMSYTKKRITAILASSGITLANLKFSRLNETEADRLGLILAAKAGYDPSSAVGFWQRMEAKSKFKTSRDWFSTHPSHANRISNIKSFLPEAKTYYRAR